MMLAEMLRGLLVLALTVEGIGIAISILLIVDARYDLRVIHMKHIGNGRRLVAQSSVVTEQLRLTALIFLALSSAGSTAVLWNIPPARVTVMLLFAMWMFLFGVIAILSQSMKVYRTRRRLFDGYREKYIDDLGDTLD